jgi:hypothetical protein
VLSITAKAVKQALEDLVAGEVHIIVKVGQGGIRKIQAAIHAEYNIE